MKERGEAAGAPAVRDATAADVSTIQAIEYSLSLFRAMYDGLPRSPGQARGAT